MKKTNRFMSHVLALREQQNRRVLLSKSWVSPSWKKTQLKKAKTQMRKKKLSRKAKKWAKVGVSSCFIHYHFQNTWSSYCHGVIRNGLFLDLNRNHLYLWHTRSYRVRMSCFCQHMVLFRLDSRKVFCYSEKVVCNSKWHVWPVFCCAIAENMDTLLLQCFLHALKIKVKKSELPLLTSTFLRNHMFSCW